MAGLQGTKPKPLLDLLDDFKRVWGHGKTLYEWQAMRNDLLCIVVAAKREEAEERGVAMNRIIDEAFRSEV